MQPKKHLYATLFFSSFFLSAFTFGGGYVIIPLMKRKFVDELHWLEEEEMLNFTAIAQSSPGPVAVNAAILIGHRMAKLPGALVAALGTVLPPMLVLSLISLFYTAFRESHVVAAILWGMRSGVIAVIADVVCTMVSSVAAPGKGNRLSSIILMLLAFLAVWLFQINVVIVILAAGAFGALRALYQRKRRAKK